MLIDRSLFTRTLFTAALLTGTSAALADSVTVEPLRDNTLHVESTGALSNGSGPHLFAGKNSSGSVRRALLAFDVASVVPPGSLVTSATLTLNMDQTNSAEQTVSLHKLSAAWGEGASNTSGGSGAPSEPGDATWIHTFYADGFWANPGGDFVASSASRVVGSPEYYTWGSTAGMVRDVQEWLDSPSTNHGWLLKGNESATPTVKRFDSRENNNVAVRPMLTVEFSPPTTDGNGDDESDDESDDEGSDGRSRSRFDTITCEEGDLNGACGDFDRHPAARGI